MSGFGYVPAAEPRRAGTTAKSHDAAFAPGRGRPIQAVPAKPQECRLTPKPVTIETSSSQAGTPHSAAGEVARSPDGSQVQPGCFPELLLQQWAPNGHFLSDPHTRRRRSAKGAPCSPSWLHSSRDRIPDEGVS